MATRKRASHGPSRAALFVDWIDEQLRADGEISDDGLDQRRMRLSSLLARCDWERRSDQRMLALSAMLSERGIFSTPALTDQSLDATSWVKFGRRLPPLPSQTAPSEKDLISYIHANHRLIEPLNAYGSKCDKEVSLANEMRVDLLITDGERKRVLVIEVEKKGDANREAPLQLLDYMNEFKRSRLKTGWNIEGMIISEDAKPDHVSSLMALRNVAPGRLHRMTFSMQLQLHVAAGSPKSQPTRIANRSGLDH